MDELISIIVPVYNAERHLAETIACVRAQTCREWELLLVEDGSADGSLAFCLLGRQGREEKDLAV